jgi:flavoprotein
MRPITCAPKFLAKKIALMQGIENISQACRLNVFLDHKRHVPLSFFKLVQDLRGAKEICLVHVPIFR